MMYLYSFLYCGLICVIAEIILDNTKLTPGHITTLFVLIGSFFDIFGLYDKLVKIVGGGALVPITSFGHLLIHGALKKANEIGLLGLFTGIFDYTAAGITAVIVISFTLSQFFKPKD